MKRSMVRILAAMLSVMMVLSLFCVPVSAEGNPYVHNFTTDGATSTFYSITGTVEDPISSDVTGKLTGDYAGYTKGLLLDSDTGNGNISFTAPSDGVWRVVLVHPSSNNKGFRVIVDGNKTANKRKMDGNPYTMEFEVKEGSVYGLGKDGSEIRVLKVEFLPNVPPCADDAHVWGAWGEDSATCTEGGSRSRSCTVCRMKETAETEPKGHTPGETVPQVDPTCSEPGLTAAVYCTECDALLEGGEEIPATRVHKDANDDLKCDQCGKDLPEPHSEHRYTIVLSNTVTCTRDGVKTLQCDVENCDAITTETVTKLGHDLQDVAARAATCTAVGWNDHTACSRCDYKVGYTPVPALGHDFDPETRECRNNCGTVLSTDGMTAGGWLETLYAEIEDVADAQVTKVAYTGPVSGQLTGEDLEYLVRDAQLPGGKTGVRVDIPGLKAGTYNLEITAAGVPYRAGGLEVKAHDHSGYAHWDYDEGVGAYKNDGTLKDDAIVLYVTEANKNTVTVTSKDGTTVTGIGNILNSTGMEKAGGKTDKGGIANTNKGIIKKLAEDGTPLVVRIVGTVSGGSNGDPKNPSGVLIEGLTAYNTDDYGGTKGDNGFMARMKSAKDVTIEGIGADAVIDGWGLHFMAESSAPHLGKSFEVRNLSFRNVPEDAIGMEGAGQNPEKEYTKGPVERCWIHNCAFYAPHIANPAESDKGGGDGAVDFKRGEYMTMDYCYYENYHKTNLVGASDGNFQYNITWHHNYWNSCDSRGPLGRQANMHVYNCFYNGQSSKTMDARANCFIFSEYNTFYQCKEPSLTKSGAVIKSYHDVASSCMGTPTADVIDSRSKATSSANLHGDFVVKSGESYIPAGDYALDEDLETARANVRAYVGTQGTTVTLPGDISLDRIPAAAVKLPYDKSFNSGTVTALETSLDNVVLHLTKLGKSAKDPVEFGGNSDHVGQNVVFTVAEDFHITVEGSNIALYNTYGETLLSGNGGTVNDLPAGTYYIQTAAYQPAKTDKSGVFTPLSYKTGKLSSLKILSASPSEDITGNLGDHGELTWTLDETGVLRFDEDADLLATDLILVSMWNVDKDNHDVFLGVKIITRGELSAQVGTEEDWDHLHLFWIDENKAPKCVDVKVGIES